MKCPVCGEETKVIDSNSTCEDIVRRRKCIKCNYRFNTIEIDKDLFEKLWSTYQEKGR